jgi:membrane protease YdiL (CAAX protease family)
VLALPTVQDIGIAAGVAGAVTATRLLLLAIWPQFKAATDISNAQIILPLASNPLDIGVVSIIPALAEEMLFRGALLPAIYPDWRGVLISGAVFGALHINGGRNLEFGLWAGSVGCVYGAAYLATGNLAVPMAAHALANVASASVWLSSNNANKSEN